MVHRREFLSSLMAVAGADTGLSWNAACEELLSGIPPKLPDKSLYDSNEEAYWGELRRQFLIPEDEVYLNNGTVGSSPAPVLRAVIEGYRDAERLAQSNPEDYPIWGYASWNQFRDPLAAFLGCTRDELVLLRN